MNVNVSAPQPQQQAGGRVRAQVIDAGNGQVVHDTGWRSNMITNYGLSQVATLPWAELFVCCAVGDNGDAVAGRDVRFPDFVKDDESWIGPAIGARSGNSVTVSDPLESVSTGDTLVYPQTQEEFLIIAKAVGSGVCTLSLLGPDGQAVSSASSTAAGVRFFIYRTSQSALFGEIKRAGRPSNYGPSQAAAGSDPAGPYFGCATDGPYTPGSGAAATATVADGVVSAVSLTAAGNGYTGYAPPLVSFSGGGAGQLIPGLLGSTASGGGQILSGGSGYSAEELPQIQILGPGTGAAFSVTVEGGVITGVEITQGGEGHFDEEYSTTLGNLLVRDPLGLGSGATLVFKPRREPRAVALVDPSGALSAIRVVDGGYALSSQPAVHITPTSYLIHERTFNFSVESGLAQPRAYAEIGLSSSAQEGANLFSRIVLRNPVTGLVAPVAVGNNQQLRVTYQLFVNFAPTVPVIRSSTKVGGWGRQQGRECFEGLGHSVVESSGRTGWADAAYHMNEPYFTGPGQLSGLRYQFTPPQGVSGVGVFISASGTAHTGTWGQAVARDGSGTVAHSFRPALTASPEMVAGNHYALAITREAQWSVAAGNNVPTIRSLGTSLQWNSGGGSGLTGIGYSYVYDEGVALQPAGAPTKSATHTLTLRFRYAWGRRLTV